MDPATRVLWLSSNEDIDSCGHLYFMMSLKLNFARGWTQVNKEVEIDKKAYFRQKSQVSRTDLCYYSEQAVTFIVSGLELSKIASKKRRHDFSDAYR